MIRVVLPAHLQVLAQVPREVHVEVVEPVTQRRVLDELERSFPVLRGTIRSHEQQRRPYVRFFADEEDLSHESPDALLPARVRSGAEPFIVVGAMSGG